MPLAKILLIAAVPAGAALLFLCAAGSASGGPAAAAAGKSSPAEDAAARGRTLDAIRDEAKALNLVQGVLAWYTRTQGEESISSDSYKGHEQLFSAGTIGEVTRALDAIPVRQAVPEWVPDPDDDRRALQYLRVYLGLSAIGLQTAAFEDEQANAETTTTVTLPGNPKPVAYRDLQSQLSQEPSAERRAQIQAKVAEVYKTVLNPIIERKEKRTQELVRELGFGNYVGFSQQYRYVNLKDLVGRCDRFFHATDTMYRKLLTDEVRDALGMKVEEFRRSDIGRLARAPHLEKFLPKELMIPAFEEFLGGIGLGLKTAEGTPIVVDDAPNPKKEPRAACFNLRVPRDIRITVKPAGGLDDYHTFFHEGGHSLHFGSTTTKQWEFQQLGSSMTTEGWAEFFSHSWDDPAWLIRYRNFVKKWNADHAGANVPTMTDEDIRRTVRHRIFWNVYFLRRYGHAKLIYEPILHGGDPAIWQDVYKGQTADLQEVYRTVFQEAYGFPLTTQDALRFRTDVDDFFYAADYTRAYGFADMMQEAMRKKYGNDWYGNAEVGKWLREAFWRDGTKLSGEEVLKLAGYDSGIDFDVVRQRSERLLAWQGE